jgi:acetyl esterase
MTRGSYVENGVGYLLETETVLWFWDLYCPDAARHSEEYASPLREKDLSRLPPALIVTAEFDPLRDEGEAYAEALSAAGNEVTAVRYDGLIHDFMARAYLPQ